MSRNKIMNKIMNKTMEKKIGRTFWEAVKEHLEAGNDMSTFHRDVDEVLADPSMNEIFDTIMKAVEKKDG